MSENPKHYAGQQKIPFGDIPAIVIAELGVAMHEGARKYGAYNYRRDAIRASDYYDAAKRHLTQWYELGEDVDPTCGISHITKAMAALAVLRDAQINGMVKDDRPPAVNREHWAELERKAQELRAKYPNEAPRVNNWASPPIGPEDGWTFYHPADPYMHGYTMKTPTPVASPADVEMGYAEYYDPSVVAPNR